MTAELQTQLPMPVESSRSRAIKVELDKCANEYAAARDQFEQARIAFEIAREKLTSVRHLAGKMLTPDEWHQWKFAHLEVVHAGVPIGEAIAWALWSYAWDRAYETVRDPEKPYSPDISIHGILKELEKGGFDFRTTTPLREINGAMMQLKEVKKLPNGNYQREDTRRIFERVKERCI